MKLDCFYDVFRTKIILRNTRLPTTLDAKHCYYTDVKRTVDLYVFEIDLALSDGAKPNRITRNTKDKLQDLYDNLQIKDNWDKPKPTLNKFNNKY